MNLILTKLLPIHHSHQLNLRVPVYCHVIRSISISNVESEYTDTAVYPPIKDVSFKENYKKKQTEWHEKIKKLPTVEQKLVELNMPKYYGYYSTLLEDKFFHPSSLEFIKFVTRTKIVSNLPKNYYAHEEATIDIAVNSIKDKVAELIVLHFDNQIARVKRGYKSPGKIERKYDEIKNQNFILDLNNLIIKTLDRKLPHISATSIDLRPRIEGFWFVGGFEAVPIVKNFRAKVKSLKSIKDDPVDRAMHSYIHPTLALRTGEGLPEVVPLEGQSQVQPLSMDNNSTQIDRLSPVDTSSASSVDPYNTDPMYWGFRSRRRRAVVVPGFWPGVKDEYGHIFFHSRERLQEELRKYQGWKESLIPTYLQQKAVVAGFTQAFTYAFYQGFTTVNELTYPVVQQSISTDGQMWQFGLYQLNTCCLHSSFSTQNKRVNLLWLSDDMKLFDEVEGGRVKGLNDEVLKSILCMYLKKGTPRENPHPYLADYKYLMHHDAPDEYKEEFQKSVFHLTAPRFSNRLIPEILPWERIYKVLFKTRFHERKLKFFENRWAMHPYTRRLDDYSLPYIPKVRRINFKIKFKPRLNSEHLFKHDWRTLTKCNPLYSDDEIVFKTMNIRKDTPPYYNGLMWSRGMIPKKTKI